MFDTLKYAFTGIVFTPCNGIYLYIQLAQVIRTYVYAVYIAVIVFGKNAACNLCDC